MNAYKAAVIQMKSQPNIDHNLESAYTFIREASREGALLAGLPENFAFLGDFPIRLEKAPKIAERSRKFLSDSSKAFEIYLLGGSFPVPATSGRVLNRSILFGPDGESLATYDKIHLFDVDLEGGESYRESEYVEAGKPEPAVTETEGIGTLGLSVCYDLRFPELYRVLVKRGAGVLTVPSAFTRTTGSDHWHPLLRARAIENTSYVFAPAQTGTHGARRQTYGHSAIIDPWGRILVDGGEETGVYYANIEPGILKDVRQSIPSLKHRRL